MPLERLLRFRSALKASSIFDRKNAAHGIERIERCKEEAMREAPCALSIVD
jgi:hypothetical protein